MIAVVTLVRVVVLVVVVIFVIVVLVEVVAVLLTTKMIMVIHNEGMLGTVAGFDDKPLRGILVCRRSGGEREGEKQEN